MHRYALIVGLSLGLTFAACGGNGGDDGTGDGVTPDADTSVMPDAPSAPPGCMAGNLQCNDCLDNDNDGTIDGADVECTSELDDDEGSFATGLPGDNRDAVWQDCFFDGDSGAGNDGCRQHICCMINYTAQQCADANIDRNFDPNTMCEPVEPRCTEICGPATPPGCDCFGCCTICDAQGCVDVTLAAPNCDGSEDIHNTDLCPVCTPVADCGEPCTSDTGGCVVCPGDTLPDSCTTNECPGSTVCAADTECTSTQFCSNGCCIQIVN